MVGTLGLGCGFGCGCGGVVLSFGPRLKQWFVATFPHCQMHCKSNARWALET